MQTPALPVAPEETTTTPLNYGPDESDVNADPLESQWFMDLLNGNGDETPMTPFGDDCVAGSGELLREEQGGLCRRVLMRIGGMFLLRSPAVDS
ncbi:hypothetical protein JHK82_049442 [Glycine max]|nr:hypothetical protein JHK86_049299 [Glycine max]KAG4935145.1 hypothetical protein JHK85_050064 [Glycine max]KAG5090664.1 hypothetical protein JHK82_049442 [Glycine max]